MKKSILVAVLALAATPAFADMSSCYEPIPPAAVDGAKATEAQMKSALNDVKDFIKASEPALRQQGFFEREAHRRLERFGAVAHVFSTYESRHAAGDAEPFARGINSIQLFHDGARWWVVTIFWDSEHPDQPIPADYLPPREPKPEHR